MLSSVPSLLSSSPSAASAPGWFFDAAHHSSKFLELNDGGRTVRCHTNGGRASQGTAFMSSPFLPGRRYQIQIRVDSKPGRMCYFFGVSPALFDVDAGQAGIRGKAFSLENLYASVHAAGRPCTTRSPPCFHAGSTVTMDVDLASQPCSLRFSGLAGGAVQETTLPRVPMRAFVSLYNRNAAFTIIKAAQV
ncbi:hypothetical protein M885DRAFT_534402 [Pelagophyceae sp. CCMP2097]|nr:hypothetical protein M885DRAFT_534402 [Pelagophyceae sp. CCMP2097]